MRPRMRPSANCTESFNGGRSGRVSTGATDPAVERTYSLLSGVHDGASATDGNSRSLTERHSRSTGQLADSCLWSNRRWQDNLANEDRTTPCRGTAADA